MHYKKGTDRSWTRCMHWCCFLLLSRAQAWFHVLSLTMMSKRSSWLWTIIKRLLWRQWWRSVKYRVVNFKTYQTDCHIYKLYFNLLSVPLLQADIPLQIGRFMLRDGNLSTLLRPVNGTANCVGFDTECGAFTGWCCGELYCDNGRCVHSPDCLPSGSQCEEYKFPTCCWPYECDRFGHCV